MPSLHQKFMLSLGKRELHTVSLVGPMCSRLQNERRQLTWTYGDASCHGGNASLLTCDQNLRAYADFLNHYPCSSVCALSSQWGTNSTIYEGHLLKYMILYHFRNLSFTKNTQDAQLRAVGLALIKWSSHTIRIWRFALWKRFGRELLSAVASVLREQQILRVSRTCIHIHKLRFPLLGHTTTYNLAYSCVCSEYVSWSDHGTPYALFGHPRRNYISRITSSPTTLCSVTHL